MLNKDDLMFSEPKHGWTRFNLNKYNQILCNGLEFKNPVFNDTTDWRNVVRVSYLTPLPISMFRMLINSLKNREGYYDSAVTFATFDAEGWSWMLGFSYEGFNIIIPNTEYNLQDNVPEWFGFGLIGGMKDIAKDWLECWEAYKNEWIDFCDCGEHADLEVIRVTYGEDAAQDIIKRRENTIKILSNLEAELKDCLENKTVEYKIF